MSPDTSDSENSALASVNEALRLRKLESDRGLLFDAGRYDEALVCAGELAKELSQRSDGWRTRDALDWLERLRTVSHLAPEKQLELKAGFDLARTAVGLLEQGHYDNAAPLLSQGLEILQRLLGPDDVQTAILLKRWADNESARGNLLDAEQAYGQALDVLARSRLGELHPVVALLHNSLEVILLHQGRLAEYEQHLRDELRIRLQLDIDDPPLFVTLNDLVVFLGNQGRYTDAIPIFEILMELYRQLIVLLPPTMVIVGGMAGDHAQQRQRQQLESQLTENLAIVCQGAAENLSRAGQQDQADALYREALALHESASGQNLHQ